MVIECARMYRSLLIRYADKPYYEIHDVVGPDEYHERVNNNTYTNRMAAYVFESTLMLLDIFTERYPDSVSKIDETYDLEQTIAMLSDSAENIFIREPDEKGIIEQFDGYNALEDVSVDTVRSRLLNTREYWGGAYGVATGTKIIKQADVVAMLSIFKDDYSSDILRKNFEYYEPRTEHGSSLSACMYALLACYIGDSDLAYPFFMKSAKADLKKGGKEWAGLIYIGGTHPAAQGGSWIAAVKGFAGISERNGELVCHPSLPNAWKGMSFKLQYRNKIYMINIAGENGIIKVL